MAPAVYALSESLKAIDKGSTPTMTAAVGSNHIRLDLEQGAILGVEGTLPNGKPLYAFRGIPYAQPPIGPLRFRAPLPLEKFRESPLECSKERDVCFQKDIVTSKLLGSEDCLYLNVYTPQLPEGIQKQPLSVMIWIHGGSFIAGSGNCDVYSPEYIVQEDIVVVSINYRLGALGFLYLPDEGIHGNAGLKDQLLAFKWVHNNIGKFGGDPNNITLFGESAGGSSIHIHTLSEESKKYFHKAICQSGTATMEWVVQGNPAEKTSKLAQLTGCKEASSKEILAHLMDVSASDLYDQLYAVLSLDDKRRGLPMAFKPVVEIDTPEAILTRSPMKIMSEPNATNIPMMIGYNCSEGIITLPDAVRKLPMYEKDLARMIPRSVDLKTDDPRCLQVADDIRQFYFDGSQVVESSLAEMVKLQTDYHFALGAQLAAELHARYEKRSSLYFYRFSVDRELNLFKKLTLHKMDLVNEEQFCGASHVDEIYYLFVFKLFHIKPQEYPEAYQTMRNMCKLWTNFAKYGNPTPEADNSLSFVWTPVRKCTEGQTFKLDYLEISNQKIEMQQNPDYDRIQFWRAIFRKFNGDFLQAKL